MEISWWYGIDHLRKQETVKQMLVMENNANRFICNYEDIGDSYELLEELGRYIYFIFFLHLLFTHNPNFDA